MVKDIKYIIKRILIGLGICLALSFIRGNLILKVDALTIAVFDSDYNVVGYCTNCTDVQPSNSSKLATANRFVITFDNVDISTNQKYNVDVTFQQSATTKTTYVNRLLYVLHQNNNILQTPTNPNLSVSNYFDTMLPSFPAQSGVLTQANYTGTFTSDTNGLLRLDIEFQPQTFSYLRVLNNVITYMGSDNSQAIGNSTQNIVNNNNQNTQNIINNNNQNTQDIIDNQNSNTDKEIESQQVCRLYDKQDIFEDNKFLTINGVIFSANDDGITDYISITNSKIKVINKASTRSNSSCFYNINKELISCINNNTDMSNNTYLTIPENASYFRATINKSSNKPTFEICTSGNQAIVDSQNNLNNTLNDDSGVNDTDIDDLFGDIRGNSSSPVSDLLTLPITLLQAYLDGMNGTCSPYNLGTLYGTSLILPCIDIPGIIGSSLWNVIDALFCLYMIYNIAMMCISIYESFTSLDDSMQLLYSPQHTGHTRVSRNEGEY